MRPDLEDYEALENATPRGMGMSWLVLGVALLGFGALAYYAYHSGDKASAGGDVMLITAEEGAIKEIPAERGGEQFPNKDKTIYDVIAREDAPTAVETLLPETEEPIIPQEDAFEVSPVATGATTDAADVSVTPDTQAVASEMPVASHIPMAMPEEALTPSQRATRDAKAKAAEEVAREVAEAAAQKDAQDKAAATAKARAALSEPDFINSRTVAKVKTTQPFPAPAIQKATASGVLIPPSANASLKTEPPKPAAVAMGGSYKIQLGSVRSDADARATWNKITAKHGDIVKGSPIISAAQVNGATYYRIKATGFASAAAAKAACASLSARGQACIPAGQ